MNPAPGAPDSTLHRAATGYRTTLVAQGVRFLCKIGSLVIVARLVPPAEHGLFAMAATVTFLLTLFRDLGAGPVAIQAPSLTAGQETALCWLLTGLGGVLALGTLALAPVAVAYYGEPRLQPLLALLAAGYVLSGANAWPRAWLTRQLRFPELNWVETSSAVLGTIAMVVAAILGTGAFAFAWFVIVSEAAMLAGAWACCGWRPRAAPDWPALRPLLRPGLDLTGYNFLLYCSQQGSVLLMGRWFGPVAVGTFNRTSQLLVQPVIHLAAPFSQVLFAALSRLGTASPDFVRHFREATTVVAHCTLPFAAAGLTLSAEIVWLMLGPAWGEAVPMLRWVSLNAAATFPAATLYALAVSSGRVRALTQAMAVSVPVIGFALWAGSAHGALGMAAGAACANLLLLLPQLWWVSRRTPVTLTDFLESFVGPFGLSLILGAGFLVGRSLIPAAGPLARLGVGVLGGAILASLAYLLWPRLRRELKIMTGYAFRRAGQPSP